MSIKYRSVFPCISVSMRELGKTKINLLSVRLRFNFVVDLDTTWGDRIIFIYQKK